MKSLVVFFLILSFGYGEGIKTFTNLKDATRVAKSQNKKVLLFVHAEYCSWCDKMKETTLKDKEIVQFVNKNYIFVSIDQDKGSLPAQFMPKFVPTTYLIDSQTNKILTYLPGYKPSEDFIEDLKGF